MPEQQKRNRLSRIHKRLITLSAAAASLLSLVAPANAVTLETMAPPGFEDLEADKEQLVDVYFADRLIGSFMATVSTDGLIFHRPEEIVRLLPPLQDAPFVLSLLKDRKLEANTDKLCPRGSQIGGCEQLEPEYLGVIYSPQDFRAVLFINPSMLTKPETRFEYMPAPPEAISLISEMAAYKTGGSRQENELTYLENRTILGVGEWRARSLTRYIDGQGIDVDEALLEKDMQGTRALAGYLPQSGGLLNARKRVFGFGLETQDDTLLNREDAFGTPLVVYLRERSRVEVFVNDRLLLAKSFPAGSHKLDTSQFPDGSYSVTLKISEGGREPRTETRYFSKDRRIPLLGKPDYDVFFGWTNDLPSEDSNEHTHSIYGRAGVGYRVSNPLSLFANVEFDKQRAVAETGVTLLGLGHRLDGSVALGSDGTMGADFRVNSVSTSSLNYGLEARYQDTQDDEPITANAPNIGPIEENRSTSRFQLAGNLSYAVGSFRVLALGNYRSRGSDSNYDFGTRTVWDIFRRDGWLVSANFDATKSSAGAYAFAGVSVSFTGSRGGARFGSGYRHRKKGATGDRSGFMNSIQSNLDVGLSKTALLRTTSGVEVEPGRSSVQGAMEVQLRELEFTTSVNSTSISGVRTNQYTLGGRSTVVVNDSGVQFTSSPSVRSSIQISIVGAREADEFELLVNNQPRLHIRGAETRFLSLPAYQLYEVRLRPISSGPLQVKESIRSLSLMPGNAVSIDWEVALRTAVFARLVDESGQPIAEAFIRIGSEASQTDKDGYFQIEASSGDLLEIAGTDGSRWFAELPKYSDETEFVELGDVAARSISGEL